MASSRTSAGNPPRHWSLHRQPCNRGVRFEALALAGSGAFADVWKARDAVSGEIVAIKQLRPEWDQHRTARRLLENEAEVGRGHDSPHLLRVLDAQLQTSPRFLLLEWLEGESLDQALHRSPSLPANRALWIGRQCTAGLVALQERGLIHGDLKPSNVFLCSSGLVKLIDLGFVRPAGAAPPELTGTPEYLAPEALAGHPAQSSRDVYGLGVLMYRMLTGRLPFQGTTLAEILEQHRESLPVPIRSFAPQVSRELAEFVERLLSKQPLRRTTGLHELFREFLSLEVAALSDELRLVKRPAQAAVRMWPSSVTSSNRTDIRLLTPASSIVTP